MGPGAQAPLRKRLHAVPKDVAGVVRELRGDAAPAGTLDLASPLVVSQLLFSTAPEGLGLDPPPGAHKNRNGHISTAGAVGNHPCDMTCLDRSRKHLMRATRAGMQTRVFSYCRMGSMACSCCVGEQTLIRTWRVRLQLPQHTCSCCRQGVCDV